MAKSKYSRPDFTNKDKLLAFYNEYARCRNTTGTELRLDLMNGHYLQVSMTLIEKTPEEAERDIRKYPVKQPSNGKHRTPRPVTSDERRYIFERLSQGVKPAHIAHELDRNPSVIKRIIDTTYRPITH